MKSKGVWVRKIIERYGLSSLILVGIFASIIMPSLILMNHETSFELSSSYSTILLWFFMPGCYVLVRTLGNKKCSTQGTEIKLFILGLIILYVSDHSIKLMSTMKYAWHQKSARFLDTAILQWIISTLPQHITFFLYFAGLAFILNHFSKEKWMMTADEFLSRGKQLSLLMSGLLLLLASSHFILYNHSHEIYFRVSSPLLYISLALYLILNLLLLISMAYFQKGHGIVWLNKSLARHHAVVTGLLTFFVIVPAFIEIKRTGNSWPYLISFFKYHAKELLLIFFPLLILLFLFLLIKKITAPIFTVDHQETSGNFGSARFASHKDLEQAGLYDGNDNKILSGNYLGRDIYLPLKNKLTLSPPGGGKTSCSSVNVLLTHPGNTFVFDVKGELWATTARYRREVLKKEVVAIDPYGIRKIPGFAKGKAPELLKEYCFNPFDWIPEEQGARDRMINAFAASFIINEGGYAQHFDENAKILIRGFIDYMMRALPKEARNLSTLYQLLCEHQELAASRFIQMSRLEGRAQAAANQISRVGSDERGSILSTSYRQIDWMSDYNIQACLSNSNFDLKQFAAGNLDIYIILPEDQVKEHQRFVRMLLALIVSLIVQVQPSQLPKEKMLFLLDELAQLGYCPDVEQAIEVLRARKLVVWTVFQTLSQIKQYKKSDLFLGAPIKQFFSNDDLKTMQWVQSLGGKMTILTKTLSNNEGDSRQKMQLIGGSTSTGESESVQETGVDLIKLNEIRELSENDQLIFVHGLSPIKCSKIRYYQHSFFKNSFDLNPLETC